ncbi:LysR family hydrogen peroxide-inducible transcriptional activator [Dysgonomonas sp. PFB1-18]|uniref:hydrogen peroxide-inducible genes activator n=1 Tax=unclassified Dysgonomonas TaxID=2630389 RepID=UPI002473DF71|nr:MULTISPECIES: hydrogen peroxide-inducible genes activator [unclassified Dysgonomonas]MDH6308884.1 LysR family hydrogen peroxide-inducible transcriptional activator [Dysgonomonas sp. PF1-14]MDH6338420.1 LysR family hydrogen peroxide-inducible transcriptional activator [Dysgonomonas sp. PF1-16]MDH6380133.1 LysR family hydrogen peroxide-inducible transcriptional activator [Dysgonomonas sp. PFB1-18]MDH6397248.1 LysR family hydrogen peroxide-inducible transcriptional activator [Dysgonomonas sp. P
MNIQQLEYIIAVDNHRHFAKAAEASFVTQPTLSMMIQKLEDELGVKIFDRSQLPVQPTVIGTQIINQARVIVSQVKQVKEIIQEEKGIVQGVFKLGIIPTIAPYLLPKLMKVHDENGYDIVLVIEETTTAQLVEKLLNGALDGAILATPLKNEKITEHPIYYERFYAYVSPRETSLYAKKELEEEDLNINRLWLLEEVHCFRGQILRICNMRKRKSSHSLFSYEAGSISTLINIVDNNSGLTIIPEMAIEELNEKQKKNIRPLKGISPVREISLVTRREFLRERVLDIIISEIKQSVPQSLLNPELKKFIVDI